MGLSDQVLSAVYPRVLIVNGEPITQASATGITASNLFAEWPPDRLAQVFTAALPISIRGAFQYQLRPLQRRGLGFLHTEAVVPHNVDSYLKSGSGNPRKSICTNSLGFLRPTLRKWLDLLPYELPDHVERAIVDFRPDVVYTFLGNTQISILALHCASLCNIPVLPHFMDDWLSTVYVGKSNLFIQRRILLRAVGRVIAAAPLGMAISHLMAEEYSARYGISFYSFMNCVSVPDQAEPEIGFEPQVGPRFIYVGGLHLDRWRSLKEIGEALACVNSQGIPGKLYVYAPAKDIGEFKDRLTGSSVEIVGPMPQSGVPDVVKAGHVMVHVESFEKSLRQYTRLSMSTKIPQYMAAARPLLCYGPGEVASMRFVADNECGLVIGSQAQSKLVAALRRIVQDAGLRKRMGTNAWTTARQNFGAEDVRARFRVLISQAANAPGITQNPGIA
jgi:hypothetical protein